MFVLISAVREPLRAEMSACQLERFIYGKQLKEENIKRPFFSADINIQNVD